ncbi:DNA-formamidopyrimidine glycosylase [Chroogloeocystis siderophila]|uniref:Formamidopyrimidine-DNA glycosylase n=1 Tax=Chroogloeocystis siderophila 5.2 s.c.1 TaxID=247279 RepID=A0A1U7HXX4_9CHRO|nr:DNA-formamidopyrimidine glycosylase [Chroogloeocystis siderophila]OKH28467.1 DNA-formamidopyrimidine glycosylase [Chroogloeocystis siderophila 5.2 s.c.1]
MPELPEVETVRRGLNQVTLSQQIMGGDVLLERTIAHPLSIAEFLTGIRGCTITQWHRYGKYLLAELTQHSSLTASGWLGVHLRMTGQLLWLNQDEELHKHTRVRLFFDKGLELRFVDQRTFGQMWWVPPENPVERVITGLAKLGLDPFSPAFSVDYLTQKFKNRQRAIKTALLDQAMVAGLGNIYADEALFLSQLRPTTLCSELRLPQIEKLRRSIIQVLETSIAAGGTTFSTFLNIQGVNGKYSGIAWVYNRTGQPCRICQTPIQRIRLAGRSSHFCPNCQR